jgi:hypothetical protein
MITERMNSLANDVERKPARKAGGAKKPIDNQVCVNGVMWEMNWDRNEGK